MEDVTLELEVIQAVGRALAKLPDADAQRRVIQWVNDRFQQAPIFASSSSNCSDRPGSGSAVSDPNLAVGELDEFFEAPKKPAPTMHREAVAEPEAGIDSLVRGFVSDFQRVALEWQGA